jgi:hypothetical protein
MVATGNGRFDKLTAGKAELWRRRLEDQRASGLSIRVWCKANHASEPSFYFWRRRLTPKSSTPPPRAFAHVLLAGGELAESIRLRLGKERELILPASMPMGRIAELLVALERASWEGKAHA